MKKETKETIEHVKPVYQHVINPGYFNGQVVYVLTGEEPSEKSYFAANEARRLVRELQPGEKKEDLIPVFKKIMEKCHISADMAVETQQKGKEINEPLSLTLRTPRKEMENGLQVCGDGDIDDSLADTMEIQGPLSKLTRSYLKSAAKEMRDTDVAINRAIENGNTEQAEFLSNQWDWQREKLLIYLRKSKIRVCPMRKKDKEKIMEKAEKVEYKQEKNKGVEKPKTRGHSRELVRTKEG